MGKVIDAGDDTLPPCRSFSQSHSHPFVPLIVFFLSYYLVYFSSCFFMMHHLALLVIILPSLPTLLPFISLFLYRNSGLVLFCCVQYRAFLLHSWLHADRSIWAVLQQCFRFIHHQLISQNM